MELTLGLESTLKNTMTG